MSQKKAERLQVSLTSPTGKPVPGPIYAKPSSFRVRRDLRRLETELRGKQAKLSTKADEVDVTDTKAVQKLIREDSERFEELIRVAEEVGDLQEIMVMKMAQSIIDTKGLTDPVIEMIETDVIDEETGEVNDFWADQDMEALSDFVIRFRGGKTD